MNETAHSGMTRTRAGVLIASGLVVFAILIVLGTWQVQRLQWKEALLDSIAERTVAAPEPLSHVEERLARTDDVEYWPVSVSGRFRHEGERHFFATYRGNSGYFVYTPLELADGRFIFVNRGFVPFDLKEPSRRGAGQVEGEVTITGLARNRLDEAPSFIVPDNQPDRNLFYWKDLDVMAATSGVGTVDAYVPFFVDANDAPNPGGLPVGGVTIIDLPNNHLQYAVTWYGLALALVGVFGYWAFRARRVGPGVPGDGG
jgi:surfeit locus 1 family protein